MIDIRKLAIIIVIAILYSVFVFSIVNAFQERPDYSDFCSYDRYEAKPITSPNVENCSDAAYNSEEENQCNDNKGHLKPVYANGCIVDYQCETCDNEYQNASENYNLYSFIFSSIFGLIAVLASIYLPIKKDSLKEWILTGFLIGGLFAIFFGTMQFYSDAGRFIKPVIILIEILLVIFVAIKKIKLGGKK